jgi:hypothetical protein
MALADYWTFLAAARDRLGHYFWVLVLARAMPVRDFYAKYLSKTMR